MMELIVMRLCLWLCMCSSAPVKILDMSDFGSILDSTDADGYRNNERFLSHYITDLLIWFVSFFYYTNELEFSNYNNPKIPHVYKTVSMKLRF